MTNIDSRYYNFETFYERKKLESFTIMENCDFLKTCAGINMLFLSLKF